MPHVIIKTISGPSKRQLEQAAREIAEVVNRAMGKPQKYISVSVEEYAFDEWPKVHEECIRDKENVIVKPGYTDPVTFS